MKNEIVFVEHKGFYQPSKEAPEIIEKQKAMLGMKPRKTFQEKRREVTKRMIEMSLTLEDADNVINENYNFKSFGEKLAFLQGMFDAECVSKHDGTGVSQESSDEMSYWAMLYTIVLL